MLDNSTIAALAKAAGLDVDKLKDAINDKEEKSLTIDGYHRTFTKDEWESHENSIDLEKKSKYDDGKKVGEEVVIKSLKASNNLVFEGKDVESFSNAFRKKVLSDADKNPDKRVQDLEKDKEQLQLSLKTTQDQLSSEKKKSKQASIDSSLLKFAPTKLPSGFTQEDAILIAKNTMSFDIVDGKEQVTRDGEVLKDKTRNNLSFKEAMSQIASERKWGIPGGGRGGEEGDSLPGASSDHKTVRKMSEMRKIFETKGISEMSSEARMMINEADKSAREAKEEFVFD